MIGVFDYAAVFLIYMLFASGMTGVKAAPAIEFGIEGGCFLFAILSFLYLFSTPGLVEIGLAGFMVGVSFFQQIE